MSAQARCYLISSGRNPKELMGLFRAGLHLFEPRLSSAINVIRCGWFSKILAQIALSTFRAAAASLLRTLSFYAQCGLQMKKMRQPPKNYCSVYTGHANSNSCEQEAY